MPATVPTQAEFDALKGEVGAIGNQVDGLANELAGHAADSDVHLEPLQPPPPPDGGDLDPSDVIVLDGVRGATIDDVQITLPPGDPRKWAIVLRDCWRVRIENVALLGGGIHVVGGGENVIARARVERNRPGDIEARDSESGVRFLGAERCELHESVVAYADCNIRAEASEDILCEGNFTYNPRGPKWRGQHFQTWTYQGQRSYRLTIRAHYALTDFTRPGQFPGAVTFQEDAFNFGQAHDVLVEGVFSEMIGDRDNYGSRSGTGLIFESGFGEVRGFTSIGHANHGWSVSGGARVKMSDSLAFFDGAGVEGFVPAGGGRTAGVCWNQGSHLELGEGVRVYGDKSDTDRYGAFWLERGKATRDGQFADTGRYMDPAAVAARENLTRPEIPDVGFVFPS